jgi:hypothetical protein
MAKRSSLFDAKAGTSPARQRVEQPVEPAAGLAAISAPASAKDTVARKSPIASTREGKRVATVYIEPEALRQLRQIALNEDTTVQALLVEGVNAIFEARGMSRIA